MMPSDRDFETICELELLLHRPEIRQEHTRVSQILDDEFLEFGRSGRIYDKRSTLAALAAEGNEPVAELPVVTDIAFKPVSETIVLMTYVSSRGVDGSVSKTLRSSLWRHSHGRWQMVFHQGTPVPPGNV